MARMYARLPDLKSYLGIGTTTTTDDVLLEAMLRRATRHIESYTNRLFEATTETRYFTSDALDREDSAVLWMDQDLLSITTLTNGDTAGTAITSASYWLLPRNGAPPYWQIRLKSTHTGWTWDEDCFVTVAGTWGYSATPPEDIIEACVRWASYLYHQKDAPVYETTAFPESGVITVPQGIPVDVKQTLDLYRLRHGR